MKPGNQALNLLQQIMFTVESFVTYQADQLEQLQAHQQAGINPFVDRKINELSDRLIFWINKHEELQNKFAELLQHLESMQQDYIDMTKATNVIFYKLKNLELINKDALYWKKKAEYYDSTRKLIFNEYMKLKNGQENNQHRGC
jgi:hypothetical protein